MVAAPAPQRKEASAPMTKRQRRRQGPNPSNTWQQQPRIKSAGARARGYIAYAGLADEKDGNKENLSSSTRKSNKKGIKSFTEIPLDPQSPEMKFGRLLGGTDQRSRHAAVKMLREYLRARSDISSGIGLSELDLLKLWKGLWYTLYMADKTPVQDKLSQVLAELMWCLAGTEEEDEYAGQVYCQMADDGMEELVDVDGEESNSEAEDVEIISTTFVDEEENSDDDTEESNGNESSSGEDIAGDNEEQEDEEEGNKDINVKHCRGAHLVSLYISTFLQTMRREWGNVDKHRLDKFYTAIRFMVSEAYKYMSKRHWNIGVVRLFNDVLYEEGLSADTPGLTNGLRYHIIDICVDELAKVNKDAELPLTEATFLDCLEPFFGLAQKAADKYVQRRVMDNVLTKFLNEYSFVCPLALVDENDADELEDSKALIFNQVHVGTVSRFIFQVASDHNTDARFRKSLYEMHKAFVRQIREAGRDVDLDLCLGEGDAELHEENVAQSAEDKLSEAQEANAIITKEEDSPETAEMPPTQAKEEKEGSSTETKSELTLPKKKKRKKKKSKGGEDIAKVAEKPAAVEDTVTTPKSKKRKKKQEKKTDDKSSDLPIATEQQVNATITKNEEGDEDIAKVAEKPAAVEEDTVTIPKTKKRKKKQGKKPDDESSDLPIATEQEVNATHTKKEEDRSEAETPRTQTKAKKGASSTETKNAHTLPTQKQNKKKSKGDKKIAKVVAKSVADEKDTMTTPKTKKRKKQEKSPPSVDPRSMHSPDRVVSSDNEAEVTMTASALKRVSFTPMNRCKSHKASMKAMKSLEKKRWDTHGKTPEKSILRPVGSKLGEKKTRPPLGPSSSKKRGRKRT